jgi:rubredoxin
MKGHICNRCDFIFPHEDAAEEELEFRYGGPGKRFLCPHCFSRDIEEAVICPECQGETLAKGEELGEKCLKAEQDALVDLQKDQHRSAA